MDKIDLNGKWNFKNTQETTWLEAYVPGSMYADLLRLGKIEDPFYRDNEKKIRELSREDFEYEKEFTVSSEFMANEELKLQCDGLDTIAEICLNGQLLQATKNMHRRYSLDVAKVLKEGTNRIHIIFRSPVQYIEDKQKKYFLWGLDTNMVMEGHAHIRKAHYMFGWDWGPQIPDMGIWRDISVIGSSSGRIEDVFVQQNHIGQRVELNVQVESAPLESGIDNQIEVTVVSPLKEAIKKVVKAGKFMTNVLFVIDNPVYWWPNGYGEQNQYLVQVKLINGTKYIDEKKVTIGLRTIELQHPKGENGREGFQFAVNGIPVFAMGANYIPEDNILSRCSRHKTEQLIQDCVAANFNCLRVWGGGIYPEDYFYELCDQYGILVWQDFAFACTVYRLDDSFREEITAEAIDNIKRYRNHAALALWCGNNEVEVAHTNWVNEENCSSNIHHLKADYIKIFEQLLPALVAQYAPQTSYWSASPSSGGGFDDPDDMTRGDLHFWKVWHGQAPISTYQEKVPFVSEFGFLSLPDMETIKTFTEEEDRVFGSFIFDEHEKCKGGNNKSLLYVLNEYKYPKGLENIIYLMQCMHGEALKLGVEYWRSHRGQCMGALYWQVNDCWPVASWSSIDNYGRWKAPHYYAKRFFNKLLVSVQLNEDKAELTVNNESMNEVCGKVLLRLRTNQSEIIHTEEIEACAAPLTAKKIGTVSLAEYLKEYQKSELYLEYVWEVKEVVVSKGTRLLVPAKYFEFKKPIYQSEIKEKEDRFELIIKTSEFARHVEVKIQNLDCVFSDNYFDLNRNEAVKIELEKKTMSRGMSRKEVETGLKLKSVADSY